MPSQPEPASPRKLRRAIERGDSPHSGLLAQGVALAAVLGVASAWTKAFYARAEQMLEWSLLNQNTDYATLRSRVTVGLEFLVAFSVPILTLASVAHVAFRVVEARVPGAGTLAAVNTKRPNAPRLRSLVTLDTVFATLISWLVALGLAATAWAWFRSHGALLVGTLGNAWAGSRLLGATAMSLCIFSCILSTSLGGLGLVAAYLVWLRRHRMSRQEKQLEEREIYGNPILAQARQRLRQQNLDSANADLTQATILVVHMGRNAAALHYDDDTEAPRLIAIASSRAVSAMVDEAQQLSIPVFESPNLATALCRGTVGDFIAEAHYASVAELLSSVQRNA